MAIISCPLSKESKEDIKIKLFDQPTIDAVAAAFWYEYYATSTEWFIEHLQSSSNNVFDGARAMSKLWQQLSKAGQREFRKAAEFLDCDFLTDFLKYAQCTRDS